MTCTLAHPEAYKHFLIWINLEFHEQCCATWIEIPLGGKGRYIILSQRVKGVKEGGIDGSAQMGMQSWVELVEGRRAVWQDNNSFFVSNFFDAAAVYITWGSANGQKVFIPSLPS